MSNLLHAKTLKDQGLFVVPLYRGLKFSGDTNFIERDYTDELLQNPLCDEQTGKQLWHTDGNQGLNLEKSGLKDIDLENEWSIKFGGLWLPETLTSGRRRPNGVLEVTHYFYKNHDNETNDVMLDKHVAEYRVIGQTVVYGTTKDKITKEDLTREWVHTVAPKECHNLEKIFRKISFASAIAPLVVSANTGALKLDSCLKRYTDWSDQERLDFLLDFYTAVLPDDRDTTSKKFQRIINSNNKETKNAGYQSYAEYVGIAPTKMKEILGWIGNTPDKEGYQKTPSRRDFKANGVDMKALMTKDIPPLNFAVKPILPEGLVAIAGRPKAMKSWTMLDLCYCVENGYEFMGHKVEKGNALYLGLEDSERRLKDRTFKLGRNKCENFPTVDVEAPYLGMGLEEDLQKWIDSSENPKLIVIDTLARVKAKTGFNKGTAYDMDNELLRKLQHLAISNGVCISFVTHLSKASQDYNFDKITGSVGLQGMTDAMWLIDRGDNTPNASIEGRGRDIMDFSYSVKWNADTWKFEYIGDKQETELNENRKKIIDAMSYFADKEEKKDVKPSDIIKYFGVTASSKEGKNISRTMIRMSLAAEITSSDKYGFYHLNKFNEEHNHF